MTRDVPRSPGPNDGIVSRTHATELMRAASASSGPVDRLADRLLNEPAGWFESHYREHFMQAVGHSLEELIAGAAPLDRLGVAKTLGKRTYVADGGSCEAGLLLYFLAVALAKLHHDKTISSLTRHELGDAAEVLAGCAKGDEAGVFFDWIEQQL